MTKKRLLLILPDVPYPERKNGLSIRYFPILDRLSKIYDLDCVLTLPDEPDKNSMKEISIFFSKIKVIINNHNQKISLLKRLKFILSRFNINSPPHGLYSYNAKKNAKLIAETYADNSYYKIIFVTLRNSHELRFFHKLTGVTENIIIDIIDSLSLHYSRRREENGLLHYYKLQQALNWEVNTIKLSSQAMYISKKDYGFVSNKILNPNKLHVVPNGVFINGYHSKSINKTSLPSIGFLGSMNYSPNIKGALFGHEIYKEYTKKFGPINYYIIGRDPVPQIKALASDPNVIVTGEIEDIWEYVNTVDVFVIHLFDGAGQQNKLLEVMYASKPVIANAISNAGIGGKHNKHLLLSEDKSTCVEQLSKLLNDQELSSQLSKNAHNYIEKTFSLDTTFNSYLDIIHK